MGVSNPVGSLKLREKPMLCFIDSSSGVRRQSCGWIFHFSLYVWTESCIPVFKVSLQTCPTADINKVIRWARQDSEGNSMLWALEEPSDSTFWQFRLSCFIVLWGGDVCCLTLNVTIELMDSPVVSLALHYCACKWEFMFCNEVVLPGFCILKADQLKYVQ